MNATHTDSKPWPRCIVPNRPLTGLVCALILAVGCSGSAQDNNLPAGDTGSTNNDAATNNDTTATNNSTTATNNGSTTATTGTAAPSHVIMTANFVSQGFPSPLSAVRVCLDGASSLNCVGSDSGGYVEMEVPAKTEIAVTAELGNYYSAIYAITTPDTDFTVEGLSLVDQATAFGLLSEIDERQDPEMGAVAIRVTGEDITPALAPDDGGEPWYLVGRTISRSDTGTPTEQSYLGIPNIPVGEHMLTLQHPTKSCEVTGWAGPEPGQLRFPVRSRFLTSLFAARCL